MNDAGIRNVLPRNKLTARISELQVGVRRSSVIAGSGVRVTETPNGTVVSVEVDAESVEGTTDSTTIIPRWG